MPKNISEWSKMSRSAWIGKTGRALRGKIEGQVLFGYVVYNTHMNMWGLYYLPKLLIAHELGHPMKVIEKGLKDLAEARFAYYDNETEYLFVVEMAHIQVGELKDKDTRISTANKYYASMPDNPLLGMFYDRYQTELSLSTPRRGHQGDAGDCPTTIDPFRSPSTNLSVPASATTRSTWLTSGTRRPRRDITACIPSASA
jgi:hypothetical protein